MQLFTWSRFSKAMMVALAMAGLAWAETPAGTAFSYQGMLKLNGQPVNTPVDMTFSLWDSAGAGSPPTGGVQIGAAQLVTGVKVTNGLFTVVLNGGGQFGATALNGNARWLQISVNGVALDPRQALVPAPYALAVPGIDGYSLNASDGNPVDAVYVDNIGRVGIGTTTPQTTVHINNTTPTFRLQNSALTNWFYEFRADNGLLVRSTSNDLLRFDNTDNITIGSTPDKTISLNSTVTAKGRMGVGTGADSNYTLYVSGDTYMKGSKLILDSPKVGIGTSNPLVALHVNGTMRSDVVEITGGSDLAEPFDVRGSAKVEPGMVVAIDADHVGELKLASKAYDPTVAGVVSGARGVNAGLVLRQEGTVADGKHPVALTGRVWCWCDADANGSIEPGNMLTTSNTLGHAMKVSDMSKAQGAIIGKAMSRLESGKGLVLVLVNLQ